jgi:23S rRNA pseudouridine2605 synthase
MKIRLNKFIAEAGLSSRRGADQLIKSGKIRVNGQITQELGTLIDPSTDRIEFEGKILQSQNFVYYAVNKPKGVISTLKDEAGRDKVTDLVPSTPRVYPVGRLDADSEGLMILTNDGELTQKLTHPSFQHEKEYRVTVNKTNLKIADSEVTSTFRKGLKIEDKLMKVDEISIQPFKKESDLLIMCLILHTGYNRQIRKMCAKIGLEVIKLERIRIGKLSLQQLGIKKGEFKEVTKDDII